MSQVEFTDGRGGGGDGRGAKSYEREKVWSSINLSVFSDSFYRAKKIRCYLYLHQCGLSQIKSFKLNFFGKTMYK